MKAHSPLKIQINEITQLLKKSTRLSTYLFLTLF